MAIGKVQSNQRLSIQVFGPIQWGEFTHGSNLAACHSRFSWSYLLPIRSLVILSVAYEISSNRYNIYNMPPPSRYFILNVIKIIMWYNDGRGAILNFLALRNPNTIYYIISLLHVMHGCTDKFRNLKYPNQNSRRNKKLKTRKQTVRL